MPESFFFTVRVDAETLEDAEAVMRERVGYDEDLSEAGIGDYRICLVSERLEYLRGEIRAERISYGELAELQELVPYIAADDVELLGAAGVPEFEEVDE